MEVLVKAARFPLASSLPEGGLRGPYRGLHKGDGQGQCGLLLGCRELSVPAEIGLM